MRGFAVTLAAVLVAAALSFSPAPRAPARIVALGAAPLPAGAAAFVASVRAGATVELADSLAMIGAAFDYKPVAFSVGSLRSTAGLDAATTLQLFGSPYRDVLATPEGDDHGNIRNLMKSGLDAVRFPAGVALASK